MLVDAMIPVAVVAGLLMLVAPGHCSQCSDPKPASLPNGSGSCVKYGDVLGSSRRPCACLECKGGFSLSGDTCQVSFACGTASCCCVQALFTLCVC